METSAKATVALHITMYFLPESPRWLIQKDRQEEALQVLARVHAQGDVNDPYVLAEFQEITAKIAYEKLHPPPSYWKLLFGEERRRMWIGIGVVGRIDQREKNFLLNFQLAILAVDDWYQHVRFYFPPFFFHWNCLTEWTVSCTTPCFCSNKQA